MADITRASTIQFKDLSAAVKAAVEKAKAPVQPQLVFNPNIIIGRILREELKEFAQAEKIATEITQGVAEAHGGTAGTAGTLTPTVLWQRNHIICGFIEHPPQVYSAE